MEYTIRKADKKDESRICELFVEMLKTIYNTDDVKGYEEGDIDKYFADGEDIIFVAEINGNVEAFISVEVHREEHEYIYLDDFSVSEKYRGNGIGNALLKEAEEYGKSVNVSASLLHVEKSNERAFKFYKRNGYDIFEDQGNRLFLIREF
ncbi:MAG: GNAT family N-acetyltransferase [Lachnospiraceae bacterium]|nr:GNAT family N-acetyltransferase [Lachnospiraceae bacterium]